MLGLDVIASAAGRPLAAASAKRLLAHFQGGTVGRLVTELDQIFGQSTGLSASALGPLFEDVDLLELLEEYAKTGAFPREQIVRVLERDLAPLRPGQTEHEAAEEVADAIQDAMVRAIPGGRAALAFGLKELRVAVLEGSSSLTEEVPTHDPREMAWAQRFAAVYYLNLPRLIMDPAAALTSSQAAAVAGITSLRTASQGEMLGVLAIFKAALPVWDQVAVDVGSFDDVGSVPIGARLAFSGTFRTKNLAGRDPKSLQLTGDFAHDPHVYLKRERRKIFLTMDPRWITTTTALVHFMSGSVLLGGLGLLRACRADRAVVSPIALGLPITPENASFYEDPS